jgi:hypothetical protein
VSATGDGVSGCVLFSHHADSDDALHKSVLRAALPLFRPDVKRLLSSSKRATMRTAILCRRFLNVCTRNGSPRHVEGY